MPIEFRFDDRQRLGSICPVRARMTMWRTNPALRLTRARHLAEKLHDLGWRRLSRAEQTRIAKFPLAVCSHLPIRRARAIAGILRIDLPPGFRAASRETILKQGKNHLKARIRAAHRKRRLRELLNNEGVLPLSQFPANELRSDLVVGKRAESGNRGELLGR